jgi:poly-gamma-glutamate synthesis protein (capsule biosynthesis protein)
VLVYPHVGGQFNDTPGAFSRYVVEKAREAGADAVVLTHSHIPQKAEWQDGVPVSYCLGNFNMNPRSYLAMPEILTNYGYAFHLYVEDKRIVKVTFSMMKNVVYRRGQICSYPLDELYATLKSEKERKRLERDAAYLYGRITGDHLEGERIRREYLLP